MKNDLETLLTKMSTTETLGEERRVRMRSVLEEYTAMRPVRAQAERRTFSALLVGFLAGVLRRPAIVMALAFIVLVASTSTLAYASEGALPGDSLYAVKIGVLEPLRGALTRTPSAQAQWQMTLATKRVDEAATLASRGTLSSTTQAQLSSDVSQNLKNAHDLFAKDSAHSEDESDADASMSARLSAYAMVFAQINTDHPSPEVASFHDALTAHATALTQSTLTLEAKTTAPLTEGTSTTTADTTERARRAAQQSLAAIKDQLSQGQDQLTASSSIAAYAKLNDATDLVREGDRFYATGDSSAATDAFKNALTAATKLNVLIRAATLLKVDTLSADATTSPLLNITTQEPALKHGTPPATQTPSDLPTIPAVSESVSTKSTTTISNAPNPSSQAHPSSPKKNPSETDTPVVPPKLPVSVSPASIPPTLHVSL